MRLNRAHRSSFYRFLLIYFVAAFLTVAGFSYLYYAIKKEQLFDESYHGLRERAFVLSSAIIDAQMRHRPFAFPKEDDVAFFDKRGQLLAGAPMRLEATKEFFVENGVAYYLDRSVRGHLGVEYILLKDGSFGERLERITKESFWLFVGALLFFVGSGYLSWKTLFRTDSPLFARARSLRQR